MVKSIVGSGLQSMSSSLGAASVAAMAAAPAKAAMAVKTSRSAINGAGNFVQSRIDARQAKQQELRKSWV